MKMNFKYFLVLAAAILFVSTNGCTKAPSSGDIVEVSAGTLNDEIFKFELNLGNGIISQNSPRVIAGNLTGIKTPIDIETSGRNSLFVLSQGNLFLNNGSIRPSIRIFGDTASGNMAPERVIDITDSPNFKPVGLAITRDFFFVSYFSDDPPSDSSKIIRFDINGNRTSIVLPVRSLGDIEITRDNSTLIAADPKGNRVLRFSLNRNFEVQPAFESIGLNEPNSIALTDSSKILVFSNWSSNHPSLNVFPPMASGNSAPIQSIWGFCGEGKVFSAPYGLAVAEMFDLRVIAACSMNSLVTFQMNANGCAEPVQRIELSSPVSVAFDRVRF